MLIMFNPRIRGSAGYKPPVPVEVNFAGVEPDTPLTDQISALLWVPGFLVGRFLYQFDNLESEADELFSVGVLAVSELVNDPDVPRDGIERKSIIRCVHRMQQYCNALHSPIKVSSRKRYYNKSEGKHNPVSVPGREVDNLGVEDDHTELLIRDVAEMYGYSLDKLTLKQKRRLYDALS